MYGKSFQSKYHGSMVGKGMAVFAVWDFITTNARYGSVEVNPEVLAFIFDGKDGDPKVIEDALMFLQQPDPKSRSQVEEGRRIVKEGQFQYRVVNWSEYQKLKSEIHQREYNRSKQAEYRKRKKKQFLGVPMTMAEKLAEQNGERLTETEQQSPSSPPP